MSDRTTAPKTGVAIQGWSGGTPDYEANRRIRPADRFGVGGLPGLYDEMVQQWSRVRANVSEAKDAARDLGCRHRALRLRPTMSRAATSR